MSTSKMFRTLRLPPVYFCVAIFKRHSEFDKNLINQPIPKEPETGWERVKKMYSKNQYDEPSIEVTNIAESTLAGTFFGACAGGFVYCKNAYFNFIDNNQASIFKSTVQAKKKLQDYVTVQFARGACKWGWRLGLFTCIFSTLITTISVYIGDTTLVSYITAGAITGGLYKVNLGLAATLVGAGLGAVLSAIGGGIILLLLKVTGVKMEDIRRAMYNLNEARINQMKEVENKHMAKTIDPLSKHHDQLVSAAGEKKIEDIE